MNRSRGEQTTHQDVQLVITPHALTEIRRHVEVNYPEEAPGGLLGVSLDDDTTIEVVAAVPADNAREGDRRRRYLIGPDDVLELERRASTADLQVVGYYHSHPDAPPDPSEFDREHAWPWYIYLIVSVVDGRTADVRAWRLSDDRAAFAAIEIKNERRRTDKDTG